MKDLFGPGVVLAVRTEQTLDGFRLLPEEAALLGAGAVPARRLAFRLGRAAAAAAVAALGRPRGPILSGPRREPLWPAGLVGSISHAGPLGVAVAAERAATAGLGIDVEDLEREIEPRIARMIAGPEEQRWVEGAGWKERLLALFSAKEALFKALYPLEQVFLDFADARLVRTDGGFEATLRKQASARHPVGTRLAVRCEVRQGMVWSGVQLER